jgi:hypothetical protein
VVGFRRTKNDNFWKKIFLFSDTDTFARGLEDLEMLSENWEEDLGRLDDNMIK